jgi:leucyl aminopeptidase
MQECGYNAGDRFWRMPVFKHYEKQLESHFADICNVGGRDAGSCTGIANYCKVSRLGLVDSTEEASL